MALPPLPCPPALLPSCPCPLLFFSHCVFFSSSNLTFVVSTAQLFFSLDLQQFDIKLSMLKKPLPPERHPAVMHSGCVSRLISPLKSPSQKKSAADCSPYCWWLCYCMPFISLTKNQCTLQTMIPTVETVSWSNTGSKKTNTRDFFSIHYFNVR